MFTVWFENCEDFGSFDSLDAAKAFVAERLEDCDWLVEDQFDIVENAFTTGMLNIQFKDTKAIVWTGTWEQYLIDFNGGLDEDNSKTFEIVPAK